MQLEISIRSITLLSAILLTGLSAGLFFAWSVSVIPGTRKVADMTYLETMQSINRAILNPAFFLIFFGSLIVLAAASFQQYWNERPYWLILAATLTYLIGTLGVTAFGNVPLNDSLDVLQLQDLTPKQIVDFRKRYEGPWNRLHLVRTICAVLAFLLALLSAFQGTKVEMF
jgi:uncharacterized membrane protein